MAHGRDTGRANHIEAGVPLVTHGRFAGVESDTDLDIDAVGPSGTGEAALGLDRARRRIPCPREGVEERIALGVDLLAGVCREHRAQNPPMLLQHVRVRLVAEPFQQQRAAFDIGEQERHGP